MTEQLAILNCGRQYTKVIDRKVRELGVKTEIFPIGVNPEKLEAFGGIILSGGPSSVWQKGVPAYSDKIFELGKPILGICYGMQLINAHFGGKVLPGVKTEYGQCEIDIDPSCPLFEGLTDKQNVLMNHGDAVKVLAPAFMCVAETGASSREYTTVKSASSVCSFTPKWNLAKTASRCWKTFCGKFALSRILTPLKTESKLR